ncbi:hypothetical protein M670_00420 [Schinkia azotoformans MEV2011]|uniref:Uncharacterized protein n=1 Tax=Schinkia azotoformans MEV2011 TaxID=1348973 RepID=A0A072NRQ5_SCHAZ|nr:hypothetical protein [Schinkia azotoformans]KEF40394.1 hypothetical protein M670_00420 [Schinkia azotoformans MEV2011]MEC1696195.1 hypothetical protein [Schinkia azotoformans]MEC1725302.1 hypothetical protein [Schinkia azotoformans]
MPEIQLPTKIAQDEIKAELALIKAYVDTLETSLGLNADATSATGSVHAKLKELRTLVDTLEGSLGQTTDAASATGTVHQKLKDIKNAIVANTVVNPFDFVPVATENTITLSSAYSTLYSYIGKGFISELPIVIDSNDGELVVTVDGVVKWKGYVKYGKVCGLLRDEHVQKVTTGSGSEYRRPYTRLDINGSYTGIQGEYYPQSYPYTGGSYCVCFLDTPIYFKSSILVQAKVFSTSSYSCTYGIKGGIQ